MIIERFARVSNDPHYEQIRGKHHNSLDDRTLLLSHSSSEYFVLFPDLTTRVPDIENSWRPIVSRKKNITPEISLAIQFETNFCRIRAKYAKIVSNRLNVNIFLSFFFFLLSFNFSIFLNKLSISAITSFLIVKFPNYSTLNVSIFNFTILPQIVKIIHKPRVFKILSHQKIQKLNF